MHLHTIHPEDAEAAVFDKKSTTHANVDSFSIVAESQAVHTLQAQESCAQCLSHL